MPAEFGRFNGGVVNVATRSGSNAVHGSLFEYFRNEDLNARNYFARPPAQKAGVPAQSVWRYVGRSDSEGQAFLLWRLPRREAADRRDADLDDSYAGDERQGIFTGVSKIFDPTTTQIVGGKFVRKEFPNDVINIPFDSAAKSSAGTLSHADQRCCGE